MMDNEVITLIIKSFHLKMCVSALKLCPGSWLIIEALMCKASNLMELNCMTYNAAVFGNYILCVHACV